MKKTKAALLSLSVVLFSSVFSFSQQVNEISSPSLDNIASEAASAFSLSAELNVREKLSAGLPLPLPENSDRAQQSITPLIEDPLRVKCILKLINDIYAGVHLPFKEDGQIFSNKEKILPPQAAGYYREYTLIVPTQYPGTVVVGGVTYQVPPSLSKRGPERMVIGGGKTIYYSPDHYKSFIEIQVVNS
ncbi:MAG TPA: hypothetical protein DCL44_04830 [Elusimicrobia bacterium]|nr:hypothetical protein [Elusimicrobiota bacterium]